MYRTRAGTRSFRETLRRLLALTLATTWLPACAQAAPAPEQPGEPAYTAEQLAELVAPVALYPDDLLAIVLPASTYPVQIVQAQRFLAAAASDPSLKPDADWDDSIVALLNYPDVVKLMNDDLDWTANLGQAVLSQQSEVIAAIEGYRQRAYTAGNLRSDDRQVVAVEDQTIYIRPADPEVIYVPYYEPARMTVYRSAPVYRYYPRPCPVYYYPYPDNYAFNSGYFWGVTTFFSLGWNTHHLHAYDYDYHGHPYYGRPHLYRHDRHYYRRSPTVVNNYYFDRDGHRGDRHDRNRADDDRNGRDHHRYDDRGRSRNNDDHRYADRNRGERADTYWRPDYRRTGTRPGTDPRRLHRQDRNSSRAAPTDSAIPGRGSDPQNAAAPGSDRTPRSPMANGDRRQRPGVDRADGVTGAAPADIAAEPPRQQGRRGQDRDNRRSARDPDSAAPRTRRDHAPTAPRESAPNLGTRLAAPDNRERGEPAPQQRMRGFPRDLSRESSGGRDRNAQPPERANRQARSEVQGDDRRQRGALQVRPQERTREPQRESPRPQRQEQPRLQAQERQPLQRQNFERVTRADRASPERPRQARPQQERHQQARQDSGRPEPRGQAREARPDRSAGAGRAESR